mgnify:CR=1 FL=1
MNIQNQPTFFKKRRKYSLTALKNPPHCLRRTVSLERVACGGFVALGFNLRDTCPAVRSSAGERVLGDCSIIGQSNTFGGRMYLCSKIHSACCFKSTLKQWAFSFGQHD